MNASTLKKKPVWIAGTGVTILAVGAALWKFLSVPSIEYRRIPVERADLEVKVLATGVVQPENRLEIKPPIPGRIETVLADEGRIVRKGQILAWMSSTERAALLDAARARGADEVKRWEDMYRPTPIVAPIDGTIILRKVEPGQTFTSQDPVLVMSNRLTVKAQVDETDIAQIRLKQKAEIVLDAYSKESIPGSVGQIAFEAKTVNNVTTYLVDIVPDQAPSFMRSGMTANVSFSVASRPGVLAVPNETIRVKDGVFTVFKADSRGLPAESELQLGISDGRKTEVTSGLSEGEVVLVASSPGNGEKEKKKKKSSSPFGLPRHR